MNETSDKAIKPLWLFALLFFYGVTWGGTIPLTKVAVSTGHQPLGLIVWQLLISIVVLGFFILLKRTRLVITPRTLLFFLVVAVSGTILPNSFSYYAAAQLPAGVMAIVIATVPMFALLIALLIRLEQFSIIRMSGVFLGMAAIVLLIGPDTSLPEPEKAVFVLIALLAPFSYGLEGNYIETQTAHRYDPVLTIFGASVIGFLIAVPAALISDSWVDMTGQWGAPEWALICSALIHAVTYVGYVWLVSISGAVFACQMAYIVTIAGVFYSILFLNETYSAWIWGSLVLMVLGLVLVQPRNTQAELNSMQ